MVEAPSAEIAENRNRLEGDCFDGDQRLLQYKTHEQNKSILYFPPMHPVPQIICPQPPGISEALMRIFHKDPLSLQFGDWHTHHMQELCLEIKQINSHHLLCSNNQHKSILKDIQRISFPHLQVLLLYSNEIESVAAIHRIHLPSLQELNLINNKLVCLKDFRKANWPNLRYLYFSWNLILEFQGSHAMRLGSMNRLTISESNVNRTECEDLRWVLKAEVQELRQVDLSHINLESKAVEGVMMRKYPK